MCPPLARSPAGNCPTDACTLDYENEEAGGDGQLYELLTLGNPSPTATFCVFADESDIGDASVGEGWSRSGLKDEPAYGYIHGSCGTGSSDCGLFGEGTTVTKTFTLPSHTQASVSMRVWKEGTFDGWENVEILADGTTVWQSDALQHDCIAGIAAATLVSSRRTGRYGADRRADRRAWGERDTQDYPPPFCTQRL